MSDTTKHHALSVASAALLLLSAVASIGFGVIRGPTIVGVAAAIGAKVAASPTTIPLMLAITLAAQMLVERQHARSMGVPIAPSRRARRSTEELSPLAALMKVAPSP